MSDPVRVVGRTPPHQNGTASPLPPTSLNHDHIAEALTLSPDNGATLDLTHKNLTDVGESGAEELATIGREDLMEDESSVLRIALGHNRLATLPMAFALLSRLRYLNLKNNSFSVFPDVLTVMPSLEILDLSRNKIKRLPSEARSLINLKVLCISRNKLTKLPSYLQEFSNLNILKVDHNPIEWPPKAVLEPTGGLDDPRAMKQWIQGIQQWINDSTLKSDTRKASVGPMYLAEESSSVIGDAFNSWSRFPIDESDFDAGVTPHARSFSVDSDFSAFLDAHRPSESPGSERLPPLHLPSYGLEPSSPSRSPESYLPTPEESVSSNDEDSASISNIASRPQQWEHSRNASYAGGRRSPKRVILSKKSLPDLRTAKVNFGDAGALPDIPIYEPPNIPRPSFTKNLVADDFSVLSPVSSRQDSGSSDGRPTIHNKPASQHVAISSPNSIDHPALSMDDERNSYFRRLSTLPASAIAKTLPESLLRLVDAARSILFAVSQIYQTLQHYTVYAIDERLASVLRKVIDPASTYMLQFINALDRFDGISSKAVPSPAVCRSVIECCKDTVAVFGKAVGVLALQLKVLETQDDVRYLRQMLLILYGATAEISHAWIAMAPHIEAVKPLLLEHRRLPVTKSHPAASVTARIPDVIPESSPVSAPPTLLPFQTASPILRTRSAQPGSNGRARTARRHAGSFSSKDVEIGKKLPSYEDLPNLPAGPSNMTVPISRGAVRRETSATASSTASPVVINSGFMSSSSPAGSGGLRSAQLSKPHSRQGSLTSLLASPTSSPSITMTASMLEIPQNSKTLVDKEALDAMKLAVEAAPAVWSMMDEILNDAREMKIDVRDSLEKAKAVTQRLKDNIHAVQHGDLEADRKLLREDAHVFVKTVIQLSNVIKNFAGPHAVSSQLRSTMVKLTNSTEEFVILLHVSSFSPSSTPRPYSPMLNSASQAIAQMNVLGAVEESKLGASLSRSRSAQPTTSSKLSTLLSKDVPRSALPTQSFNIGLPWRGNSRDEIEGPS